MRIATKYQVDSICQAVKHHLEAEWPTSIEGWLRLTASKVSLRGIPHPLELFGPRRMLFERSPEPASTIRLAVDFNIPSVLPAAFYLLSTLEYDDEWDATRNGGPHSRRRVQNSRFKLLKEPELFRYFQGKYRLAKEMMNLQGIFFDINTNMCAGNDSDTDESAGSNSNDDKQDCTESLDKLRHSHSLDTLTYESLRPDPIQKLYDIYKARESWDLCENCFDSLEDALYTRLTKLWDDLPGIFNLTTCASSRDNLLMEMVRSLMKLGQHQHRDTQWVPHICISVIFTRAQSF